MTNIESEVRKDANGEVDEVLLYLDGECIFHLETMSEKAIWFALYVKEERESFWINSKNNRSHIEIKEQ